MLEEFTDLVRKWTRRINLISAKSMDDAFERHTLDSAQIYRLASNEATTWADFGSGGGFPGLVIAIMAKSEGRDLHVTLVESDQRKSVFLATAARNFGLNTDIRTERVESIQPLEVDVISARALAPLDKLLDYADRHGRQDTVCLFPKGRNAETEIQDAKRRWNFSNEAIPSITDPEAAILRIKGVSRVR